MSNEQENIQDQLDTQKMSNEINTIVNQEIGKEKETVISQDAIHVMPQKFLPTSPKKQLSNKQKIILGSIAFVIFLLIVVGSMLLFANLSVSNNQAKTDQNNTENQGANQIVKEEQPLIDNSQNNIDVNQLATSTATSTEPDNTDQSNNNNGIITPPPPPPPTSNNFDQDRDDLSIEEELIFGTNNNDEDTDNDGYKDGVEVINLYNPLLSNQALIHSSLISQFSNQTVGYVLLKPKNWLSQAIEGNDLEIMFTPDSGTGDFMNISAEAAIANQTLTAWAQSKAGGASLSALTLGKEAKITALQSKTADAHTIFAKVNNHFIKFTYHIETEGSAYFASTYLMMLNSFSLLN